MSENDSWGEPGADYEHEADMNRRERRKYWKYYLVVALLFLIATLFA